jgi:prophage antirepressor-like protein
VCAALGIANGRDAVSRLDPDGVGNADIIDGVSDEQFEAAGAAALRVCDILDIGNPSQAISYLDADERSLITNEGRSLGIVSEARLYSLILRSRKPEAKAFKRWVTDDVPPAIAHTFESTMPPLSLLVIERLRQSERP